MPNIELHGYPSSDVPSVRGAIRKALGSWPELEEVVTTVIPSDVQDLHGKRSPFLRLIAQKDELEELEGLLVSLGEDIEVFPPLRKWIPKSKPA